ncbi:serine racemase-like [Punica granatum]|uniref:Serine racemase-like n=1 Tax=Punica granatum TaxID=22663 RepID=A0A6P8DRJ6_PUNGR|nr:serine racemase-like [Punica granatum]
MTEEKSDPCKEKYAADLSSIRDAHSRIRSICSPRLYSKAAGRIITLPETYTIADGLRAFLGDLTWPVVRDFVDDIIVVDDSEIIEAMKLCYEILKLAVEPSGAIGLAAVLSESFRSNTTWNSCSNVAIILSGGNLDLGALWNSYMK